MIEDPHRAALSRWTASGVEINGGAPKKQHTPEPTNAPRRWVSRSPKSRRSPRRHRSLRARRSGRGVVLRFAAATRAGDARNDPAWRDGSRSALATCRVEVSDPSRASSPTERQSAIGLRICAKAGQSARTLDEVKQVVAQVRKRVARRAWNQAGSTAVLSTAHSLLSGSLFAVCCSRSAAVVVLRDVSRRRVACAISDPRWHVHSAAADGRSLNVISLEGSHSRSEWDDAAVVGPKHRAPARRSVPRGRRAQGTRQVGGALFASTLTPVAVFCR